MERKTFLKSIGAEGQEKSAELIEAERTANELGNQFCEAGLDIIQKLLQNILIEISWDNIFYQI